VTDAAGATVSVSDRQLVEHRGLGEVKLSARTIRWKGPSAISVESRPLPGFSEPTYPAFSYEIGAAP